MIESSLDWVKEKDRILEIYFSLNLTHSAKLDFIMLEDNLDRMVRKLSNDEVDARRTKVNTKSKEQLDLVNDSIRNLEKLLMLYTLTR